jgi:hypothetical protein
MDLFTAIKDAHVILRSRGIYRQAKVYARGERLFAGYAGGFIRLGSGDMTSVSNVKYEALQMPPHIQLRKGNAGEPLMPFVQVAPLKQAA